MAEGNSRSIHHNLLAVLGLLGIICDSTHLMDPFGPLCQKSLVSLLEHDDEPPLVVFVVVLHVVVGEMHVEVVEEERVAVVAFNNSCAAFINLLPDKLGDGLVATTLLTI